MPRESAELTADIRNAVIQFLLQRFRNNKLEHGAIRAASMEFNIHRRTVSRLWKRAVHSTFTGSIAFNVDSRKTGRCGRKRKDYSANIANMKDVPLNRRGTIRSVASAIGVPKSTLHRRLKEGTSLKRISSSVKPELTKAQKLQRLRFCLEYVQPNGMFQGMYDHVHIDEKWFYITKTKRSYYLHLDEPDPHRTCKSKRFITKVMFMAAVARPRWNPHRKQYFNGKLGIWPFVVKERAKRNSKNRPKGTLVTKVIDSVTSAEIKKMIIEKVMPAIRAQFPVQSKANSIYIQQDNAKPHATTDDVAIVSAGTQDGWNIKLKCQPANSPDLNVLDLGFFNAIQSLQHQINATTIDSLIEAVESAFACMTQDKLDNVFLTLQSCMEQVMLNAGNNAYKLVHMNKEKLRHEHRLPSSLSCSPEAIATAKRCLQLP